MGKKGKNTAKKKAARQEAKAAEKTDRELRRDLPAKLDALLAKAQEETKDIDLFADPPPKEVCPICLHPHSPETVFGNALYMVHCCCGKKICRGCSHASELATDKINQRRKKNKEPPLLYTCAFCREPKPNGLEEEFSLYKKRMALNDGESIRALANMRRDGVGGPMDEAKALDLYCHAAELGAVDAYCDIGVYYYEGTIVEKNQRKAMAFYEISAKKGDIHARHNLGACENNDRNIALAIRHFKIAAEAGYQPSLDELKNYAQRDNSLLQPDELADILRVCLASQAEMKTDQRDAWAKAVKQRNGGVVDIET